MRIYLSQILMAWNVCKWWSYSCSLSTSDFWKTIRHKSSHKVDNQATWDPPAMHSILAISQFVHPPPCLRDLSPKGGSKSSYECTQRVLVGLHLPAKVDRIGNQNGVLINRGYSLLFLLHSAQAPFDRFTIIFSEVFCGRVVADIKEQSFQKGCCDLLGRSRGGDEGEVGLRVKLWLCTQYR